MSTIDLKLGNNFLHVLRLPAEGKGFVVWKEHLELSVQAQGLYGHLDGTTMKLTNPPSTLAGTTALTEQVSTVKKCTKDLNQYLQEQAIVFQQITSMIFLTPYI